LRKEMRVADRQIWNIQREAEKLKLSLKDAAKKGQKDICVVLAKEEISSRKSVSKLYASKAHMNSLFTGMKNKMNRLINAGIVQRDEESWEHGEMLENTFEIIDDQEEMEKAAEMEIEKILFEITTGVLDKAPSKVTNAVMEPESPGVMATSEVEGEEEALEAMHPSWSCFVA
ncbi:hypothetical protein DBR06_SOUSAS5310051, partial [Sousa chinensis]